ncbi:hypothetical protein BH23PSE1_BH23PSE1_04590 [soil metagenome]
MSNRMIESAFDEDLPGGGSAIGQPVAQAGNGATAAQMGAGRAAQNGGGVAAMPQPRSEGELVSPEVAGDPVVPPLSEAEAEGDAGAHAEVDNVAAAESSDVFEASPEQLAGGTGAEGAFADLEGSEGFESASTASQQAQESDLPEVGSAMPGAEAEASEPEFAFLAALIPAIVSTVGPPLAKAISRRLKPATRGKIKALAKPAAGGPGGQKGKILALLAKLLQSAEAMPSTESGESDPALAETAAAAMESIIGPDERLRITNTQAVPWRMICALRITFPNGKMYRGTGFFIGPRAVATAGHCVYLRNQGGWAREIEVMPGANGTQRPFGSAVARHFRSVAGWVTRGRPASDYGCIILPPGAFGGRNLGAFGFAALSPADILAAPAVLAGYPGDKPFAEAWGMKERIRSVSAEQLTYTIDTAGGQSGSPVYVWYRGLRTVGGFHNYGGKESNTATRITPSIYQRLDAWRQIR